MIISPSKTQQLEGRTVEKYSRPALLAQSERLVRQLSAMSEDELAELMQMSPKLAALTFKRYQKFSLPFSPDNARQALLVFRGDQFSTIAVDDYRGEDFFFAQKHLRILSGLYGVLRPLDLIQPYRLEMATRLATDRGKNLYGFWGDLITGQLRNALEGQDNPLLINLASDEYFKALQPEGLHCPVVKISFKEIKNNRPRVIAIHAKRARGMMVDFIIRRRVTDPEMLKNFSHSGYTYCPDLSMEKEWVFTRSTE
ncbi:MAG TPA: peroxide stress protein YaaA [Desulfobulbus sp.]|nr:peroxide stress protein YaaA [Desulfobulbus sp.]